MNNPNLPPYDIYENVGKHKLLKQNLFDYLMENMSYTAERNPNGERILTFTTHGEGTTPEAKNILKYYHSVRDNRSKEERFVEYQRLKEEFENDQ